MSSRESTAKKIGNSIERKPNLEILDGGKLNTEQLSELDKMLAKNPTGNDKLTNEKLNEFDTLVAPKPNLKILDGGKGKNNLTKSEQDELDELNFLVSHQSPKQTASRIKEIADLGELETAVLEKSRKIKKAPSIESLARKEGLNQIEEADLTQEAREIPSIDELLKVEQEKIDNKIHPQKIETQPEEKFENKNETFNENLIDEVQKIHGNIGEEEKTQYVIDKLIARELEENNGEFADENLRADLKKLNVILPSEIEFNKLLIKKENEDKPSKVENKFFDTNDETDYDENQNLIYNKEETAQKYDQLLISEQKKVDALNRNDRFNFDNLLDISRTVNPQKRFKKKL